MSFDPAKVRLERFRVEMVYHSAYNYLSLKGVLAERWAHGPIFGAMTDQGNQVTLTPEDGFKEDRVDGIYGIKASSFDRECVKSKTESYEQAKQWLGDVLEVLKPKRTTRIAGHWFALYPLTNVDAAEAATRRLKVHYLKDEVGNLQPEGYENNFVALTGASLRGDRLRSFDLGAVGPPHKGSFFAIPDKGRDESWWMGLKFNLNRTNEDGIDEPAAAIEELLADGDKEFDELVQTSMTAIF
jgi:hypothetical protein